jgi:hypothetical protein
MLAYASRWLFAIVLFVAAPVWSYGQESAEEDAKAWLEARTAEFAAYEFEVNSKAPVHLKMEPRSLLNWANGERRVDVGALFLWTHEGQPALVACAFGRGKGLRHEFHSLSTGPIMAERKGAAIHRFAPGIAWRKLPEAPSPAATRVLRLVQMRRLAERFRVTMGEANRAEMRLLTQPVFRSTGEFFPDAAVFAFVQGTDPECVLTLQAAEKSWQYALTRQTKWAIQASLDGTSVLDLVSFTKEPKNPESPFYVVAPPSANE